MIYHHEDFKLDLTNPNKGKLYKSDTLVFLGDGYKAITILINNSKDSLPVKKMFNAQLNTRQQCRFTKDK